ncbi:small nuclear ribonucleoprotein F [Trichonephila inaurata madagascariensis]|uniref:Small nuclear ribonucleoprotein F n=1 Tax=Trichonephila inaurata madagascariensis TaxID=2747483 RepID=A0A8X6YCA5_9ARAC|nr:small nuclear ribonucleoprotein F [Trichonephila inaurata madagascariensis]
MSAFSATEIAAMSAMKNIVNPRPFMKSLIGKWVNVKLKWGLDYRARLALFDGYMNVELELVEEVLLGEVHGRLDKVLVRCNNILYVRELDNQETEKIVQYWQTRGSLEK